MINLPGNFAPGTLMRGADMEALKAALQRVLRVRGDGIRASWTDQGLVLQAMAVSGVLEWARITAASRTAADVAEAVTYTVRSIDRPSVELTNVYPSAGRPCAPEQSFLARIYPAKVGALVAIVWNQQNDGTQKAELWLPGQGGEYESLAFKRCGPAT